MFISAGTPAGDYNDMWSFNISSGNWTWRGGSNTSNPNAIFPAQVGGVGWPSGLQLANFACISTNMFVFGGYNNGLLESVFL